MPPDVCAAARQVYGSVRPGHYWMDGNGTWGLVGSSAPRGNIYHDARRGQTGGRSWTYQGRSSMNGGSDGRCTYFSDPKTVASVMLGDCN